MGEGHPRRWEQRRVFLSPRFPACWCLTWGKHAMPIRDLEVQKAPLLSRSMRQQSLRQWVWWTHLSPLACRDSLGHQLLSMKGRMRSWYCPRTQGSRKRSHEVVTSDTSPQWTLFPKQGLTEQKESGSGAQPVPSASHFLPSHLHGSQTMTLGNSPRPV